MFDNQAGPACSVKILLSVLVMHCGLDYFYVYAEVPTFQDVYISRID